MMRLSDSELKTAGSPQQQHRKPASQANHSGNLCAIGRQQENLSANGRQIPDRQSASSQAVSRKTPKSETALPKSAEPAVSEREAEELTSNGTNCAPAPESNSPLPPPPPQPPAPEKGFVPVLKNSNFLSLWGGQVFSQLADKVYLVLMIALIANRFHTGSQTISSWVSAIMIAFTIPAVLLGSLAGAFVDRWQKKAVLVATNLLRGVLVLALPALLWLSQGKELAGLPLGFCLMLAVTFLVSTLTQFFAPAEQAAIPLIVDRRHLLSANSLYTTTMMGSLIVGFAVGEPLLALADRLIGFADIGKELVVGGSYVLAGLLLLLLRTGEKINPAEKEYPHVLEDIRDGLRYLKKQPHVRAAMIQLVILFSIFAALAVLAVPLADLIPGMKASQFGFLLAAGGAGLGLGAAVIGHAELRLSHFQLSMAGSAGMAASLVGMSLFSQQLWPELLLIALLGAFAAVVGVPVQTTIQAETPEEMRGKVFGLQNNAINIALSLPLALAGVAEAFLGLKVVFLGLAALTVAGGFLTWYISRN